MSDTDIDFMDPAAAREYVLSFIVALKRAQKERAIADEELEQWERRVKLADSRGEPILKRSAEARVAELKARRQQLLEEERQLSVKVDVLKEKFRGLAVRCPLSVDADAALAQLSMLVGDPAGGLTSLSEQLKSEEAAQALEELKRRLREEGR
jgi:chromosome condensin MukBEF ATPase and DNA-binding subunit MukB